MDFHIASSSHMAGVIDQAPSSAARKTAGRVDVSPDPSMGVMRQTDRFGHGVLALSTL